MKPWLLAVEFTLVFVGLPAAIWARWMPLRPIPTLIAAAACALWILWRDAGFDRRSLWRWSTDGLRPLLARFTVSMVMFPLLIAWWAPGKLFVLPRTAPLLWAALIVLYPLLSVLPQELLFRPYFFHRYRPLFGNGAAVVAASAAAFAFAHVVFGHPLSVMLTALGGVLFGLTYRRSGSMMLAALEHALYGDLMFTAGLGDLFYHGAAR